jgi:hypothetical protein
MASVAVIRWTPGSAESLSQPAMARGGAQAHLRRQFRDGQPAPAAGAQIIQSRIHDWSAAHADQPRRSPDFVRLQAEL